MPQWIIQFGPVALFFGAVALVIIAIGYAGYHLAVWVSVPGWIGALLAVPASYGIYRLSEWLFDWRM